MHLFAPALAFVDLETTGMRADRDASPRSASFGSCRSGRRRAGRVRMESLVNPGEADSGGIQAMTGITDAMVRDAPTSPPIASEVAARTAGCVFVAHNARFDYGFLKHEFARLGGHSRARVLCTVKLSRRLFPDAERHNLDSVIERHALADRATATARLATRARFWALRAGALSRIDAAAIAEAARAHAPHSEPAAATCARCARRVAGVARRLPVLRLECAAALYRQERNLRERVGAHFSSDYRSATDLRLSAEIRRIDFEETAGEIGALLREAALVKAMLPAHNQRLAAQSGIGRR